MQWAHKGSYRINTKEFIKTKAKNSNYMRLNLVLIGLLMSLMTYAQEEYYIIDYYVKYDLGEPRESKDILYINANQDKSFYQNGTPASSEGYKPRERRENEVIVRTIPKVDRFNYFNFKEKRLVSRISPLTSAYMVEEEIPLMHWELVDETKKIKEIELHKAVCSFRGRNYTAWYSLEYPIHIGPWKFNGLPGLAFEITEDQSQFSWSLTSVKKSTLKAFPLRYDLKRGVISLKEYVERVAYEFEHMDDSFLAKLPKGMEIISVESDNSGFRKSELEIVYEWEKQ